MDMDMHSGHGSHSQPNMNGMTGQHSMADYSGHTVSPNSDATATGHASHAGHGTFNATVTTVYK